MAVTDSTPQEVADYRAQIEARKAKRTEILDRFVYHAPTHTQATLLAECHNKIMECAEFLVDRLPDGRDRAVALTSLEDTRMKMNKAIIFSNVG